jgi:hypothetical protein
VQSDQQGRTVNRAFVFVLLSLSAPWVAVADSPLLRAHAHNDYQHARPLLDALSHGFRSVEADIWLTNGALLVAHDLEDVVPGQTLEKLYLEPLRQFVLTNRSRETAPFTLMIDVKSAAESTYAVLRETLRRYTNVLTRFESNGIHTNYVMVIISGNRAVATMGSEPVRFAAVDGRLPDLATNLPPALVPLVSDNWTKHFQWRGEGPLPPHERTKLADWVAQAHHQGRRIRFWATPDNRSGWSTLHEAGVDLLNTDKLGELSEFLRERGR